jgi:hypothetical protein
LYGYGYVLFKFIYYLNILKNPELEKGIILYGHKFYGNLKSLYDATNDKYDVHMLTLDYKEYRKLKSKKIRVLFGFFPKDLITAINSKIFVTDHGLHYFKKLLNNSSQFFIDVNHGLPFQKWNEKIMKQWYRFDEVWLFSEMHKEIYINDFGYSKPENLIITGYGRLDYIKSFNSLDNKYELIKNIKTKYKLDLGKKTVIYAPTWIHNNSFEQKEMMNPKNLNFLSYLNSISEELSIDLIFRPHLNTNFSSREVSELRSFKSLKFMPQSDYGEIEEILTISDILITDYSSISLDYILLNRPVLFLNTPSSFSLGTFKEEILKFGKKVDQPEIKYFLDLYLNKKSQYFRDCPQHMETLKTIYDDPNTLASSNYIERIKKII